MTTSKAPRILSDVIAVQLNFSIWTGRKKLADSDLSISGERPPKEVVNLGSKHTTDPKALNVFSTLKRQAERLCLSVGIPFLGGYAIPTDKADDIAKKLAVIIDQFETEKANYLLRHDSIQDDWIQKFPAYESILRQALTPTEEVEKRITAAYSMFQVQSAQGVVTAADTGLDNQVDGLTQTLDEDILKNSRQLLKSLTGAIHPNQTNVRGLKSLREKIDGLAFLDSRFNTLVSEIQAIEAQMPTSGKLETAEVNILSGLLYRMSDETKLAALMGSLQQPVVLTPTPSVSTTTTTPLSDSDFDFDFDSSSQSLNPAENSTFF
ncbi:hypothetical protein BCS93_04735 [Vibrio breoganii]|uniref:DUF3150 domain-containing protein n=1 Tax=Vibrio breoganii TaxID=553239 RepID=A0AAP8N1A0_9VIBR|nr:DUF3150 domain-containing protein [Vibrio breoganii]PMP14098.1 hypothetical protein BCS93_04735 [Vibrio breoganii]